MRQSNSVALLEFFVTIFLYGVLLIGLFIYAPNKPLPLFIALICIWGYIRALDKISEFTKWNFNPENYE